LYEVLCPDACVTDLKFLFAFWLPIDTLPSSRAKNTKHDADGRPWRLVVKGTTKEEEEMEETASECGRHDPMGAAAFPPQPFVHGCRSDC
jgi:hypothetical protein